LGFVWIYRLCRATGVIARCVLVEVFLKPVSRPLRHVPCHVLEADRVGVVTAYWAALELNR